MEIMYEVICKYSKKRLCAYFKFHIYIKNEKNHVKKFNLLTLVLIQESILCICI